MEQFNRDTYKKETLFQEFYHSCLGKIIILIAIFFVLFIIAIFTVPTEQTMRDQTMNHIHACLQDNDGRTNDEIDEIFANVVRSYSEVDTTLTKREMLKYLRAYNTIEVYEHTGYKTVYLHNARHPQGVRISVGIFTMVISTLYYSDMVLDLGPARGDFNQKLIEVPTNEPDFGENPHLKPYHYKGNPED